MKYSKEMIYLMETAKHQNKCANVRVAAGIMLKPTIFVIGKNINRTDPLAAAYGKNPDAIYIHAEINAIKKVISLCKGVKEAKKRLRGATIYIARVKQVDRDNVFLPAISKPCDGCLRALKEYNIKKMVYFDLNGDEITEQIY